MTVRPAEDGAIGLEGDCPVEEAETLLAALLERPEAPVDWRRCNSAHTAVVQVLLALQPSMVGEPDDEFLRRWVAPLLPAAISSEPQDR